MARITANEKQLIRRYLIWFYKVAKEELDRTDRKFTQLLVDGSVLKNLEAQKGKLKKKEFADYEKNLQGFRDYMAKKKQDAQSAKFQEGDPSELHPQYLYLRNRLFAVEHAIIYFLGRKELQSIQSLYEKEMTRRILEAREHT